MTRCSFCGREIAIGTGKMFVQKDGRIQHFCSSKCEKNQIEIGRKNRTVRWTAAGQKAKEERIHASEHDKK